MQTCGKQLANRTGGGEKCYPLYSHLLCKECHSQRAQSTNSLNHISQHWQLAQHCYLLHVQCTARAIVLSYPICTSQRGSNWPEEIFTYSMPTHTHALNLSLPMIIMINYIMTIVIMIREIRGGPGKWAWQTMIGAKPHTSASEWAVKSRTVCCIPILVLGLNNLIIIIISSYYNHSF